MTTYQPSELIELIDSESEFGSRPKLLFNSGQLRVMRLELLGGKELPEHQSPNDITVHCLAGEVEFKTMDKTQVMRPGQMLYLPSKQPHAVKAIENSIVLVTLASATPS